MPPKRYRPLRKILSRLMLGVCMVLVCLSCQSSNGLHSAPEDTSEPTVIAEEEIPTLSPAPNFTVNADRLKTYLEDLSFERYSEGDRQAARNYIENELAQNDWDIEEQSFPGGINIIASKPQGELDTQKPEIIVGAHYDSIAGTPGADDNATSVAATLEISHLLDTEDFKNRTLKLVFFDREEQGAVGSSAYTNVPEALTQLDGIIVLEMLGYTCYTDNCQQIPSELNIEPPSSVGDFVSAIVDSEHPQLLKAFEIQEQPLKLFGLEVPFKGLLSPMLLRSDHAPFWLKGTGAVMVSDTGFLRNPNYHRKSDTPDSLDIDFFTQSTELITQATYSLLQTDINLNG